MNLIRNLKITGLTRKGAIELIKNEFPDQTSGMGNLIATNIVYDAATDNKTVKWGVNLDAIIDNFKSLRGFNDDGSLQSYTGPSLFINGSYSTKKL